MSAAVIQHNNHYVISSPCLTQKAISESFDPNNNKNCQLLEKNTGGRNPVWHTQLGPDEGILRHYYRGGLIKHITTHRFFWGGIEKTRAVAEYRLLEWMRDRNLDVPEPLGAHVKRHGLFYTCDLITRYIPGSITLGSLLKKEPQPYDLWHTVGNRIKTLHNHRVWHSDLNAHNILISGQSVILIDFDQCKRRNDSGWEQANLDRLERSLLKLKDNDGIHFSDSDWQQLLSGYTGTDN